MVNLSGFKEFENNFSFHLNYNGNTILSKV